MMDLQNDVLEDKDFATILAEDIDFSGTLSFEKDFLVRGKLKGTVEAQGLFMVDTGAVVEADITAPKVIVRGLLTGNVTAGKGIELASTGTVKGNIDTPVLSMEAGCVFNGLCSMDSRPNDQSPQYER
ncbi:MAG: polymer-forming cytoskeletal protein [Spirochaetaceae bacterium]|jgi:cytoskeletal protein CcmA (bactofilin family)|nr:polymer-forming cytoskeletal protein [Spirochaetaceae bacterium]